MAATVAHSQAAGGLPSSSPGMPAPNPHQQTQLQHLAGPGSGCGPDAASQDAGDSTDRDSRSSAPLPLQPSRKFQLSDFRRVRTLGTGTFARVCLVRPAASAHIPLDHQLNPEVYALKILRKPEVIRLKQIDHVRHERALLADVAGHPFITNLLASFADHDSLYMVLDYVPGGELFTYLRKLRRFEEPVACFYAAEIVLVLEFLHEHQGGIAYRDLKPENLLLDKDGHIKLVDFGFAKRLGHHDDNHPAETYTLCGTPEYLAPEVIQNKGHTGAVDWWALGILMYEFMTGYPPFWHQNPIEIYKQILEKPIVFPQDPALSDPAKDIIRSLCTVDRSRRLGNISGGAARVKSHPFFRDVSWDDLLNRRRKGPIVPPIRYPGDAQCFDVYPEDDGSREPYPPDMAAKYDPCFADF